MGPIRSSCWIVALHLFMRRPRDTWFSIRASDNWYGPHIGVVRRMRDGRIRLVHYVPISPKKGWRVVLDVFWFRGKIVFNRDEPRTQL